MKRIFVPVCLCLAFAMGASAQQPSSDAPASREDIQRYLEVTHSRQMVKQMMDIVAKSAREMAHDQFLKNKASLPPDAEERINKCTEDLLKNFPIDDVFDVFIGVYQKHWTKADVDNLVAFYSTPTGQKLINEMPQTMAEAMQAMRPILQKQTDGMTQQIANQVAQLKKEYKDGQGKAAGPVSN